MEGQWNSATCKKWAYPKVNFSRLCLPNIHSAVNHRLAGHYISTVLTSVTLQNLHGSREGMLFIKHPERKAKCSALPQCSLLQSEGTFGLQKQLLHQIWQADGLLLTLSHNLNKQKLPFIWIAQFCLCSSFCLWIFWAIKCAKGASFIPACADMHTAYRPAAKY